MMRISKFLVLHNKNNHSLKVHFLLREVEADHQEVKTKHQRKDSKIKCKKF